ncbi:hypothetical protein OG233_18245 [Streptomyces sp. NBC_01218]|uniref:hypothetical protein n=1 Tax=Streptomyces sp. NBC_01218 TaxID=2903780 RepID=UPI002E131C38|nr:hypothetical protein OG233_18245 [Streptomyces sp. NBC_01218]
MTGWRGASRTTWWVLAGAGAAVAAGLLVWVTAADLERSSQIAGVLGTVVGVVALGVACRQLRGGTPAGPAPAPAPESVRAAGGSNAARGTIRAASAHDTAPGPAVPGGAESPGITATGGSNAAGGDIDGSTARHGS